MVSKQNDYAIDVLIKVELKDSVTYVKERKCLNLSFVL